MQYGKQYFQFKSQFLQYPLQIQSDKLGLLDHPLIGLTLLFKRIWFDSVSWNQINHIPTVNYFVCLYWMYHP